MIKDNTVIFKGGKTGIAIVLDENASFEQITQSLRAKILAARGFFAEATTSISFKGKTLSEHEIITLIDIITSETDLSITFVQDLTGEIEATAPKPTTKGRVGRRKTPLSPLRISNFAPDTHIQVGGLRSGQTINHNGTVVILGDVNGGAEVIATGSIVVFGIVRGMVHAGAGGDKSAYVCAISMRPTQLRIADIITYFPKDVLDNAGKVDPVYAFIEGDEIYVSPVANFAN